MSTEATNSHRFLSMGSELCWCYRSLVFHTDDSAIHYFLAREECSEEVWSRNPPGRVVVYDNGVWRLPPDVRLPSPDIVDMQKVYIVEYNVSYMDR